MSSLLALGALRRAFDGRAVLDIGHLALEAGQGYVMTGSNGSGKTTLLRALAGLEPASIDGLVFEGRPVAGYPDWLRKKIVYVHQQPYLFHTSIAANIGYGLRARGVSGPEYERRVREAMAWAGLGALAATPPAKLSGGEKQKVALARARVLDPRIFMFDEPTASLDGDARAQTIALVGELVDADHCVVVACHDRELIELPHMHRLHLEDGGIAPVREA